MSLINFDPYRVDLEISRGTSFVQKFLVPDPSTNIPVDVSLYIAEFTAMRLDTREIVMRYTNLDSDYPRVSLGVDGFISVKLIPQDTEDAEWNRGFYNITLLSPDNVQTKISRGFITLEEAILGIPALAFPPPSPAPAP